MKQPGLDQHHRDKNGEISRKHGNTLIGTLRKHYGAMFAKADPYLTNVRAILRSISCQPQQVSYYAENES